MDVAYERNYVADAIDDSGRERSSEHERTSGRERDSVMEGDSQIEIIHYDKEIYNIRTTFEQLTSLEDISKGAALQIMQLFHAMETLLVKSENMRNRETAELKHELASLRIRNDHDELKKTHAKLEQYLVEKEQDMAAKISEQVEFINRLQSQLPVSKKKGR
jgi:hypothetical protein